MKAREIMVNRILAGILGLFLAILFLGGCATSLPKNNPSTPDGQLIRAVKCGLDPNLVNLGNEKAKQMGFNPVPAYLSAYGDVKSNKFNLQNNDMLINVGRHPFTFRGVQLDVGEFLIFKGGQPIKQNGTLSSGIAAIDKNSKNIITIKGEIENLGKTRKLLLNNNSCMNLVKVYDEGSKDAPLFKIYRVDKSGKKTSLVRLSPQSGDSVLLSMTSQLELVYYSELPPIQIPSRPNFTIKLIDLKPGRYAIAVQRTKTEPSYLAKNEKEEPVIINIPATMDQPLLFDLGKVFIPLKQKKK
jgi:hypothetical protein